MIHIKGNYYLDADSRQYMLIRIYDAKTSSGDEKKATSYLGYFTSIPSAITKLLEDEFRAEIQSAEYELKDALVKYGELMQEYRELLKGIMHEGELLKVSAEEGIADDE